LVDDHSVQASGMFSTVAATVDNDYSNGKPAAKRAGKKWRVGPSEEDGAKSAAKPASMKRRALQSLDLALVPSKRPLESGHPVPEGLVPQSQLCLQKLSELQCQIKVTLLVFQR